MPCKDPRHTHTWPDSGVYILRIESCEVECDWCPETQQGRIQKNTSNLRKHAQRHINNPNEKHLHGITIAREKAGRKRLVTKPRRMQSQQPPPLPAEDRTIRSGPDSVSAAFMSQDRTWSFGLQSGPSSPPLVDHEHSYANAHLLRAGSTPRQFTHWGQAEQIWPEVPEYMQADGERGGSEIDAYERQQAADAASGIFLLADSDKPRDTPSVTIRSTTEFIGPSDQPPGKPKDDMLLNQIWRLYSKTKTQLPNQERMENLTWRMIAMKLRKREKEVDVGGG